jgi:hypothetical protein
MRRVMAVVLALLGAGIGAACGLMLSMITGVKARDMCEQALQLQRDRAEQVFGQASSQASARIRSLKHRAHRAETPRLILKRPDPQGFRGTPQVRNRSAHVSIREIMADTLHDHIPVLFGLQTVPPQLAASNADLHMHRLTGDPRNDPPRTQHSVFAIAAGSKHAERVNRTISRLPLSDFQPIVLVYDGFPQQFHRFHWSSSAIIISAPSQTKWWFARRFLHPEVVKPYDFVWVRPSHQLLPNLLCAQAMMSDGRLAQLWDEDIELPSAFDANKYVRLPSFTPRKCLGFLAFIHAKRYFASQIEAKKRHGLQISQPALTRNSSPSAWPITWQARNSSQEIHRNGRRPEGVWCEPSLSYEDQPPPCGSLVEIMVPVFSRAAWACTYRMCALMICTCFLYCLLSAALKIISTMFASRITCSIPNDLVHGWGLDMRFKECAAEAADDRPYSHMGVIDSYPVKHMGGASLGAQGVSEGQSSEAVHSTASTSVDQRRKTEWSLYNNLWKDHLHENEPRD